MSSRPTLAVALIVKNEEKHLAFCLDSVKDWVDEIIILDSGSTDATEEIANQYQAKFYKNTNWQGFGKQRQLAQQYVSSDYVLWLDADERVTPELKQSILLAIEQPKKNTLYQVNRLSEAFGKKIQHSGWYPDFVVRLYKTQDTKYNNSLVHEEVLVPSGFKIERLSGDLLHYTYDDLHHCLVKSANYAAAWATQKQNAGKKTSLFSASMHAIYCFIRMYIVRAGFLDGKHGFLLALLSSHSTFVKYADLWIRQQTQNENSLPVKNKKRG